MQIGFGQPRPNRFVETWVSHVSLDRGRRGRALWTGGDCACLSTSSWWRLGVSRCAGSGTTTDHVIDRCPSPCSPRQPTVSDSRSELLNELNVVCSKNKLTARQLTTWHCSPLLLRRRCCWAQAMQQSIDISCPPRPQQQTRRTLLQRSMSIVEIDRWTGRQTDRQTDRHRTVT